MTDGNAPARLPARVWMAAAAAGLVLRLLFGLLYWVDQPMTRDEREYLALGRSLAAGHGFVADPALASDDPFGRAPGYPAFLALAGAGGPVPAAVPARVKVLQSLIGAGGVILIAVLATRLAGVRAGRAAAWIAATYPPLVWIASYAFSEAIFWPLALGVAWLFDRAAEGRGARGWILGGVTGLVAGAGILVRPGFLLFLPLAALWLLWRRRPAVLLALTAAACIVVAPWTVRNYGHYHRFVLVASEGGVTFWTGNHPLAIGEGDLAANPDLKRASLALRAAHPDLSEERMEPIYYREALDWIRAHPIDWLELEVKKVFYLIVPIGPSYRLHSPRYFWASIVSYGLLVLVAAVGSLGLGRRFIVAPGLWIAAASAVLLCLIFFPQERFRIPSIDPALIVSAGAAFRGRGGARA